MANSYILDVVTPERSLLSESVTETIAPGSEGDLGILAGHTPLMTELKPGEVQVTFADGRTKSHLVISGGFMEVTPERTTILADSAERADEVDLSRAEADLATARQLLASAAPGSAEFSQAKRDVALGETRIRAARGS